MVVQHSIIVISSDVTIGKTILKDNSLKEHLKLLKQIKKDLKRNPKGTPMRKRDKINVDHRKM